MRRRDVIERLTGLLVVLSLVSCEQSAPPASINPVTPAPSVSAKAQPLSVYTDLNNDSLADIFEAYRAETGIRVAISSNIQDADALPAADLYLLGSLAALGRIAEADGFRPYRSSVVAESIPSSAIDTELRWSALAVRPRLIFFNTSLVTAADSAAVSEYAALRGRQFENQLCLSSSGVSGNRSLVAMLIHEHGVREAELIVRAWLQNLAAPAFANDGELIAAVADGECAIGIADSGLLFRYMAANRSAAIWVMPLQPPAVTLTDVTGAGIARHAHDPEGAASLLEWLATAAPNALLASGEFAFPANPSARISGSLDAFASQRVAPALLTDISFLLEDAEKLIERAHYP